MSPFVIAAMGIGIVFSVLSLIACLMWGIGKIDRRTADKDPAGSLKTEAPRETPSLSQRPSGTLNAEDALDPQILAVITAAAFAVLKKPCRIRRIRPYQPSLWAIQGRDALTLSQGTSARELP